jgi:hypothetical protein
MQWPLALPSPPAGHPRDIQPNPAPRCPPQDAHTAADDSFLSPGRRLSTTCTFNPTQVDEFTSEVGNVTGACGIIELESGVYNLTQTLTIARGLTIRALTEAPGSVVGTVVLDGQNSVRVFHINSSDKVSLIGLDITKGKASSVRRAAKTRSACHSPIPDSAPDAWKRFPCAF